MSKHDEGVGIRRWYSAAGQTTEWHRALLYAALGMILLLSLALIQPRHFLVVHFLWRQDLQVVGVAIALYFYLWKFQRGASPVNDFKALRGHAVIAVALMMGAACYLGHLHLMYGYALSRDEQLALFGGEAIQNGRIYGIINAPWQSVRAALNLNFMAEHGPLHIWMPVYLNGNALLHALVGIFAPMNATAPLLASVGLLASWGCSRLIWPGNTHAHLVTVLLFTLSAQQLATAMTSYAMTAHLTLNMIWLWLFLKDRPWSHAFAALVGLLATGLHQLPFHPLFAMPILCLLPLRRRWRLTAFYLCAYAFIGLFWMTYLKLPGIAPPAGVIEGQGVHRVASMAGGAFDLSLLNVEVLAAGLLRFFAWQNLMLLPLMLVGAHAAWRSRDPLQLALLASFLLIVVVKFFMRPYQGHGWGYRYLHGLIGVACLSATYGWVTLRERGIARWPQFRAACLVTALITIPWLLFHAHLMVREPALVSRMIDRQHVDAVIVDNDSAPYDRDLVFNRPDLNNRPIRLLGSELNPQEVRRLCGTMKLAEITSTRLQGINRYFGSTSGADSKPPTRPLAPLAPPGCFQSLRP